MIRIAVCCLAVSALFVAPAGTQPLDGEWGTEFFL